MENKARIGVIMKDEIVKIKGIKAGFLLLIEENAKFSEVVAELEEKLEQGNKFFCRGNVVQMDPEILSTEEIKRLAMLFDEYGILFRALPKKEKSAEKREEELFDESQPVPHFVQNEQEVKDVQEMVVINRTLRGGQEIRTESSVLVCGNVNPGAVVIAGGDIDVRGTCRGTVHAGAFGNRDAVIIADRLMPVQIRIADMIARSPDTPESSSKAEKASLKDGKIIIEPIER